MLQSPAAEPSPVSSHWARPRSAVDPRANRVSFGEAQVGGTPSAQVPSVLPSFPAAQLQLGDAGNDASHRQDSPSPLRPPPETESLPSPPPAEVCC